MERGGLRRPPARVGGAVGRLIDAAGTAGCINAGSRIHTSGIRRPNADNAAHLGSSRPAVPTDVSHGVGLRMILRGWAAPRRATRRSRCVAVDKPL